MYINNKVCFLGFIMHTCIYTCACYKQLYVKCIPFRWSAWEMIQRNARYDDMHQDKMDIDVPDQFPFIMHLWVGL